MLDRLPLHQQGKLDACGTPPRRRPRSARSRALRLLRGALLAAVLAAALASPDLALAAKRFSFAGTTSQPAQSPLDESRHVQLYHRGSRL
jgi:hypothetical protein